MCGIYNEGEQKSTGSIAWVKLKNAFPHLWGNLSFVFVMMSIVAAGTLQGMIIALLVLTISSNKLESMAVFLDRKSSLREDFC